MCNDFAQRNDMRQVLAVSCFLRSVLLCFLKNLHWKLRLGRIGWIAMKKVTHLLTLSFADCPDPHAPSIFWKSLRHCTVYISLHPYSHCQPASHLSIHLSICLSLHPVILTSVHSYKPSPLSSCPSNIFHCPAFVVVPTPTRRHPLYLATERRTDSALHRCRHRLIIRLRHAFVPNSSNGFPASATRRLLMLLMLLLLFPEHLQWWTYSGG